MSGQHSELLGFEQGFVRFGGHGSNLEYVGHLRLGLQGVEVDSVDDHLLYDFGFGGKEFCSGDDVDLAVGAHHPGSLVVQVVPLHRAPYVGGVVENEYGRYPGLCQGFFPFPSQKQSGTSILALLFWLGEFSLICIQSSDVLIGNM